MLSGWQWALLAAIPPAILALYFLKLKRTPLEVPSTYLWRKSIEDLHVNSIWQRLRTSILLLLQMLVVAVAMLTLLRPGWSGSQLRGTRFVFMIDNSASMSATDVAPNRLAEAKRRVGELVDQMASGDVAMIVSFADSARVAQEFTDDRAALRRQLDAIAPTNRTTSIDEALRVASGLASSKRDDLAPHDDDEAASLAPPATLYLFSDGNFPDVAGKLLSNLNPIFVPIGAYEPPNVAITAFNTKRREDHHERLQAFGRLENFGPEQVAVEVELHRDGALLDAQQLQIAARASSGVVFELGDVHSGTLELRLRGGGDLTVDDVAWSAIDPPTRSHVLLVTPGNDALELALKTDGATQLAEIEVAGPEELARPDHLARAAGGYYSLIIYDQCQPSVLPQANTLFIGRLPPGSVWKAGDKAPAPTIIDVDTAHPLLHLIDLGNVKFAEATPLAAPPGATVLVATDAGPLLAIAPREGFEDAVLGAEIVGRNDMGERYANSDWPLRLSFPVFVWNSLTYFGGSAAAGGESLQPGKTEVIKSVGTADELTVTTPAGQAYALKREHGAPFVFSATDALGVYTVAEPNQPERHFCVNLFDHAESNINPRAEIELGHVVIEGQRDWQGVRRELWKPLLLGALGVLCLEWYIYNRRVYL